MEVIAIQVGLSVPKPQGHPFDSRRDPWAPVRMRYCGHVGQATGSKATTLSPERHGGHTNFLTMLIKKSQMRGDETDISSMRNRHLFLN